MIISSRQHPFIQQIRSLHAAKGRREHGLFLIEGRNAVAAALSVDFPIRQVLALESEAELSEMALDKGIEVRRAAPEILSYAGEAQSNLEILALGEMPGENARDWPDFTLVLDGISDPGNVGTLWRGADAAGANGVISVGGADPFSPKVVRSAAGSTFHLLPRKLESAGAFIEAARAEDVAIVCAQAHGAQSCFDFEWPTRTALVLGHETRGIGEEISAAADFSVSIPIYGRAESLNAAMAGVVLLFAWAQKRN